MDDPRLSLCRCDEVARFDGSEAEAYANTHLRLIERGRDDLEMYQCDSTATSWILDFPLRHWAADRRGRVRLRRESLDGALPIGTLDLSE